MMKNYVIINIETNGYFNMNDDTQIIFLEAIKVDKNLHQIASFKTYIKPNILLTKEVEMKTHITNKMLESSPSEHTAILDFINFCKTADIITHNAKFELSFLLKALYKNKIYTNFNFKYLDLKELVSKNMYFIKNTWNNIKAQLNLSNVPDIDCIIKILKSYLNDTIKDLQELFYIQPFHGKIFRGLTYPKYLCDIKCDNKYFGYLVDGSEDRYISYYTYLKELNGEYFTLEEVLTLKNIGATIIMNVSYFDHESQRFTDYYSLDATNSKKVPKSAKKLIDGITNFVTHKKKEKLILFGDVDTLREAYSIIEHDTLEELISLIDIIKNPWEANTF